MKSNRENPPADTTRSLRKILWALLSLIMISGIYVIATGADNDEKKVYTVEFERAIALIKKYEGLHKNHPTLIGYGHMVRPTDKYKRRSNLTLEQADQLLREDFAKLCTRYRSFGADSLILAALAYNCGTGTVAKSSVMKKLQAGDRDISEVYLAHSKSKGKTLSQLKKRRQEELDSLFTF